MIPIQPLMDFDPLSLYTPSPLQNEEVLIPIYQGLSEIKENETFPRHYITILISNRFTY